MKKIFLVFYYSFAKHLPDNYFPFGKYYNALRIFFLSKIISIGKNTVIQSGFRFGLKENLRIGNNCEINENVYIQSALIGDYVLIAQNVSILAMTHNYNDKNTPIIEQGFSAVRTVVIEDDVWIGRNVTILPGLTLGKGCVIGTGSVVTKDVLPYKVMAGVPARIISERGIN